MQAADESEHRAAIIRDGIVTNRRRLNGCDAHHFDGTAIDWERGLLPARFVCLKCGGWLPDLAAVEYARGFAAAGGNPELVLPGFTR